MTTKLRHIGECQICEGDYKVRKGLMVHHGYQRPGWGYIVGDCPGVDEPPYEVSCEAIKRYRERLLESLESANKRHDELEAGTAKITAYKRATGHPWERWEIAIPTRGEYESGDFQSGDPDYERLRKSETHNVMRAIGWLIGDIDRATKRIEGWVKKPIRTVEEHEDEQRRLIVKAQRGLSHKQFRLMKAMSTKTKATFDIDDLKVVLAALGWNVEDGVAAVRLDRAGAERWTGLADEHWHWSWGDKNADVQVYFNEEDAKARAKAAYERLLEQIESTPSITMTGKKGPGSDLENEHVYVHLEKPTAARYDRDAAIVPLHAWLGVPAWTATAPGGDQVKFPARVDYTGKIEDPHEMKSERFWKFAYAHGLDKLAKEWIEAG